MEYKGAIKKMRCEQEKNNTPSVDIAYAMAIEAMKKQIPKIPKYEGDGYADGMLVYDEWLCPNCDSRFEVDYDEYEYCPKCGQHIDHSEYGKESEE